MKIYTVCKEEVEEEEGGEGEDSNVMNSIVSCKKHLVVLRKMKKKYCCFFFLLVLLLLSQASPSSAEAATATPRFGSFRDGSPASKLTLAESATTLPIDQKDGDAIFGDEKRRIYTGPNPLHNR